jgi:hypothetical protein
VAAGQAAAPSAGPLACGRLRFRGRDEVAASLIDHGFVVLDVREAPDRVGRELVFVAEREDGPQSIGDGD